MRHSGHCRAVLSVSMDFCGTGKGQSSAVAVSKSSRNLEGDDEDDKEDDANVWSPGNNDVIWELEE